MADIIVDDSNAAMVVYSPPAAWTLSTDAKTYKGFEGTTYHYTYAKGASVTFSFVGSYVAYYADLNGDHDAFVASLDGGAALQGTSKAAAWSGAPRLLFEAHVARGPHTLAIANAVNGSAMGIDFFVYRETPAPGEVASAPAVYRGHSAPQAYTPFVPPAVTPTPTPTLTPSSTPTPTLTPTPTPTPTAVPHSFTAAPPSSQAPATADTDDLLPETNAVNAANLVQVNLLGLLALVLVLFRPRW